MASIIETAVIDEPVRQVFEEMAAGYEDTHARLFAHDPDLCSDLADMVVAAACRGNQ